MRYTYILCNNTICDGIMSYMRYRRGHGPVYRRIYGLSQATYRQGLRFGKGFGIHLPINYKWFPRTQEGWMMNQRYPNMRLNPAQGYSSHLQQPTSQNIQHDVFSNPYTQQVISNNYQQSSMQTTMTHMNCAHFRNGFCTLKGVSVDPNGPACQNFAPR